MGQGKQWTKDEYDYLKNNWGYYSISAIAKNLNRSIQAIKTKASRLKLGSALHSSDKITFNQLFLTVYGHNTSTYTKEVWVKNDFPIYKQKVVDCSFDVVDIDKFWKWAEIHSELINFSDFPQGALGIEPEWVPIKRKQDEAKKVHIKTSPWTKSEDELLKQYLRLYKYSYNELSKMLMRSCGAIQKRICDLGLRERPIKAENHNKWSKDDFHMLGELIKQRYTYESMSDILNRSSKAIRGRVFDYYLTENLDNVRVMIDNGSFGDNLPERPIRYMRVMTDEDKKKTKSLLSNLAWVLREKAKYDSGVSEEYKDFWQKDMCKNWSDIYGCTKSCSDCDSCNQFQRIAPQGCVRCGCTFYERKKNKYCAACRNARLKSAKRKYAYLTKRKAV